MSGARAAFERKLNGPMVPQACARDRMVLSVVINFSSKVYSKSLLKGSPLSCTSLEEVISCPEVWRPIFCKSKKDLYLDPEVWRPIFWKVKRIYILFQKYGGRYLKKYCSLIYFVVSVGIAIYTIVKYVPFIIKAT